MNVIYARRYHKHSTAGWIDAINTKEGKDKVMMMAMDVLQLVS